MNTNWYLARGLRRHGRPSSPATSRTARRALIEKSGFREYYDPRPAKETARCDFSWTAVVVDMLARLEADKPAAG